MVGAGVLPANPEVLRPLPLPDKPSIAVLPFQNMTGDPEKEYFADGIVEDIITALARMPWAFRYHAKLELHLQRTRGRFETRRS